MTFDLSAFGLSLGGFLVLFGAAFLSSLARGFSGFGSALIFIPLVSAVIGPAAAAPLLLIVDTVPALGLIPNAWRNADRREVGLTLCGATVGIPVGVLALVYFNPLAVRWAIVAVVAALLALLMSGWHYRGQRSAGTSTLVGGVAGLLAGLAQIGGPPLIAYWLNGTIPAQVVRANMMLFFAVVTVFSAIGYWAGAMFTLPLFLLALTMIPIYAVGLYLGTRLFGLASDTTFRRACYVLIALAVIGGLPALDGILR